MTQSRNIIATREQLSRSDPDLISVGRAIRTARSEGSFESFCVSIGIHTRKAYDLITIVDAIDARLLTPSDVTKLGWSKARLVAKQVKTRAQARLAVAFAARNTLPAVVAYLRDGGTGQNMVTKSFNLSKEQALRLDAALMAAGVRMQNKTRMANRSEALLRIVDAYRPSSGREGPG